MTESLAKIAPWVRAILDALPLLVLAILFITPLIPDGGTWPGFGRHTLGRIVQIEWLLLASSLFLIMPLLWQPRARPGQIARLVLYVALAWAFGMGAYSMDGVRGVAMFAYLLYASYGGHVLFRKAGPTRLQLTAIAIGRLLVSLVVFFPFVVLFDLPRSVENWDGTEAAVKLGAAFFSISAMLELGVYSWLIPAALRRLGRDRSASDSSTTYKARLRFHRQAHPDSKNR